jgi:hypothetical protein
MIGERKYKTGNILRIFFDYIQLKALLWRKASRNSPGALMDQFIVKGMNDSFEMAEIIAGNEKFASWRLETNDPAYAEHYANVCAEVPEWSNMEFGVFDKGDG